MKETENPSEICLAPWNLLRIEANGNCYSCSSAYVKDNYCLGNIFTDDINEIWNGEKARQFRADKLSGEYKFCQTEKCHLFAKNMNHYVPYNPQNPLTAEKPRYISLSYDYSCSERCVFCRDKTIVLNKEMQEKWESIIQKKTIPLVSNAKIMEITCAGELFSSIHSQKIVKEIIKNIPDVNLKIFTNGIYITEEKLNELGIINNIEEVCLSIHCATEKTYKKIFRNNNFAKVMKNIEYIANLKKENKIKIFGIEFVITKDNYKEIKQFLKMAEKYGSGWTFNYVVPSETKYTKNPYNYEIYNPKHYLYNDYIACLQDPYVKGRLPEHMKALKPVSNIQIIKNYIRYILYLLKNIGVWNE